MWLPGGMHGCRGCAWLLGVGGGICGCGGHAWLQGGHAWLSGGACIVAGVSMCGCQGGMLGCRGACVVAGGCMVVGGGMCRIRQDTVNERAVRILLQCILVVQMMRYKWETSCYSPGIRAPLLTIPPCVAY